MEPKKLSRRAFVFGAIGTAVMATTALPLISSAEWKPKLMKSKADWKKELTPEQYKILFKKGTERAFTGEYWDNKKDGTYACAACETPIFSSEHKFDSGTGWPSYWQPIDGVESKVIHEESDWSIPFLPRTEVVCATCGGHQGHVFKDGPEPTGLRYCINSAAMKFIPKA